MLTILLFSKLGARSSGYARRAFDYLSGRRYLMSQYMRVQTGMTYSQIVAILGPQDQELSHTEMMGVTTVMYMWKGNSLGGNMNVMLQDGKVISKAQFGLK